MSNRAPYSLDPWQPQLPVIRDPGTGQSAGPPGVGTEPQLFHEPGGDILRKLEHPAFKTFELLTRALPEEGWFNASPSRPAQGEFPDVYRVPNGMKALVFDYTCTPFGFGGIDPDDTIPMQDRFSSQMGFDINVENTRISDMLYRLDPAPAQVQRASFTQGRATANAFNVAASASFASVSGQGLSLLPIRRAVQGAEGCPWTWIVDQGKTISLVYVIFRAIGVPLAFLQARVAGYLIAANTAEALVQRLRPR